MQLKDTILLTITHFFPWIIRVNRYSHWYSYGLIALTIAHAITGHSRTSESTAYSLIVLGSV